MVNAVKLTVCSRDCKYTAVMASCRETVSSADFYYDSRLDNMHIKASGAEKNLALRVVCHSRIACEASDQTLALCRPQSPAVSNNNHIRCQLDYQRTEMTTQDGSNNSVTIRQKYRI